MSTNTVAPSGSIDGPMSAPAFDQKEKVTNKELLGVGPNIGKIFAVIDLGTHMEKDFAGGGESLKRKIYIGFEHPQLKQKYYVEDEKPRSCMTSIEGTFNMADNSKLKKICDAVSGKILEGKEKDDYNIGNLLGAIVCCNIAHKKKQKDGVEYEAVSDVFPKGAMPLPVPFEPELEQHFFYIDVNKPDRNFTTTNFANLPPWLRTKILKSQEAITYEKTGGKFAEKPKSDDKAAPAAPGQNLNGTGCPADMEWLSTDFTYQQMVDNKWTDELLIENGYAKRKAAAPAPPSAPNAPAAPQMEASSSFNEEEHNDLPF